VRYHFHILHLDHTIEDEDGREFTTFLEARNAAENSLHGLLVDARTSEVGVVRVDAVIAKLFRDR
jgi:hypothetical protein